MQTVSVDKDVEGRGTLMAEFYAAQSIAQRIAIKRIAFEKGYLECVNLMLKHLVPE